ncbi:MAG: carbonic anhydrase [Bacteroidota bacterium]
MFLLLLHFRKNHLQLGILQGMLLFAIVLFSCNSSPVQKTAKPSKKKLEAVDLIPDSVTSPEQALDFVKEGYNRYLSGRFEHIHIKRVTGESDEQQDPFVAIITCKDFSIPPEILFDLDKKNLLVLETPANTETAAIINIVQTSVSERALKLILILGHSNCETIRESIFNSSNDLPVDLKTKITRSIPAGVADTSKLLANTTIKNISQTISRITAQHAQLDLLVKKGTLKIAGAYYDAEAGELTFNDDFE